MEDLNIFDLANLKIKVNENGFSIWLLEPDESGELHHRWIVDGSDIRQTGEIRFGKRENSPFTIDMSIKDKSVKLRRR